MREINITAYCDACIHQGTAQALAEDGVLNIKLDLGLTPGSSPREMDLCSSCVQDFISMSRMVTKTEPAKTKKSKGNSPWVYAQHYGFDSAFDPAPWGCSYCDLHSKTEQGIKQHLSRTHKDMAPA